eukprot:1808708-Rhodomonas_salina.1
MSPLSPPPALITASLRLLLNPTSSWLDRCVPILLLLSESTSLSDVAAPSVPAARANSPLFSLFLLLLASSRACLARHALCSTVDAASSSRSSLRSAACTPQMHQEHFVRHRMPEERKNDVNRKDPDEGRIKNTHQIRLDSVKSDLNAVKLEMTRIKSELKGRAAQAPCHARCSRARSIASAKPLLASSPCLSSPAAS